MATVAKMIDVFTEVTEWPTADAQHRARRLREAGMLSQRGHGRAAAQITDADAATFLLGILAPEQAIKAPETVKVYNRLRRRRHNQDLKVRPGSADADPSLLLADLIWLLQLARDQERLGSYSFRLLNLTFAQSEIFPLVEITAVAAGQLNAEQFCVSYDSFGDDGFPPNLSTEPIARWSRTITMAASIVGVLGNLVGDIDFHDAEPHAIDFWRDQGECVT